LRQPPLEKDAAAHYQAAEHAGALDEDAAHVGAAVAAEGVEYQVVRRLVALTRVAAAGEA